MGDTLDKGGTEVRKSAAEKGRHASSSRIEQACAPSFIASAALRTPKEVNLFELTNVDERHGDKGGECQQLGMKQLSNLVKYHPQKYDGSPASLQGYVSLLNSLCSPSYRYVEFVDLLQHTCLPEVFTKIMEQVYPKNETTRRPEMPVDYTLDEFLSELRFVFGESEESLWLSWQELELQPGPHGIRDWCAEVMRLSQALNKQED